MSERMWLCRYDNKLSRLAACNCNQVIAPEMDCGWVRIVKEADDE